MSQQVTITDVPVSEPVTMINAFTVPFAESERFMQRGRIMLGSWPPGFIRARMYGLWSTMPSCAS
jgi:hypothetical protein